MTQSAPPVSRRRLVGGLIALPATAGLSQTAVAASDHEAVLRQRLAKMVFPFAHTELALIRFKMRTDGQIHMHAVVKMTWAPGIRQHGFQVTAPTAQMAQTLLLSDIFARFSAAA